MKTIKKIITHLKDIFSMDANSTAGIYGDINLPDIKQKRK